MAPTGHYLTLGIPCDATMAEVKKAYRKLALQHHPDKNQGDEVSAERFKEVTAAYEVGCLVLEGRGTPGGVCIRELSCYQ